MKFSSPCPIWQQQIPHLRVLPSQLLSLSHIQQWAELPELCRPTELRGHMLGLIAAQPQPFPATCSRMHNGNLVEEGRGGGNWYSSALRSGWPEQQQREAAVLWLPAGSGAEKGEVLQPWPPPSRSLWPLVDVITWTEAEQVSMVPANSFWDANSRGTMATWGKTRHVITFTRWLAPKLKS